MTPVAIPLDTLKHLSEKLTHCARCWPWMCATRDITYTEKYEKHRHTQAYCDDCEPEDAEHISTVNPLRDAEHARVVNQTIKEAAWSEEFQREGVHVVRSGT